MTNRERIELAAVKGTIQGHLSLAKGSVIAAHRCKARATTDYARAYHTGVMVKSVDYLRSIRSIQRSVAKLEREANCG